MKFLISLIFLVIVACPGKTLSQIPNADFRANITRVCVGNAVTFSDSTTNNPTSWSWTLPGGTPNNSNVQQPSITYNTVGNYNVTLMATNANGSDTETKNNYIRVLQCKPSQGIYRIAYANGTNVFVGRDHMRHAPVNSRVDINGTGGGPYTLVAAEDGVIEWIEDSNNDSQGVCDNNNYVWISHPNGEWTKYSHMAQWSTSASPPNGFGRFVGETICAGTPIGIESDIGCASGPHLHFEVAIPNNLSNPFDTVGGFINGINLVPVICHISTNKFITGNNYTAQNCTENCQNNIFINNVVFDPPDVIAVPIKSVIQAGGIGIVDFNQFSAGIFRAGDFIKLGPGFHAKRGSVFTATIKDCDSSPGLPQCNIMFLQGANQLYRK